MKYKTLILLFCVSLSSSYAEMRIIYTRNSCISINTDFIISITEYQCGDGTHRYYSRAQGKIIVLDPNVYASSIAAGLSNGNLTPVGGDLMTRVLFKKEANIQVATAGSGIISGGDAKNVYPEQYLIVDAKIQDVLRQLYTNVNK